MILRVRARTLLVIVGVAACSGKGGNNSGTSFLPEGDPNGGFDTPSSGFDVPPPSTDAPGGQDTPPPDHDSPTGDAIGATCVRICTAIVAQGCADIRDDVNTCLPDCNDLLDEYGPCAESFASFLECLVRSPRFACDIDDGFEDGDFGECNLHAQLLQNCIRVHDPDPDGGGGTGGQGGGPQGGGPQGGSAGDAPTGGSITGGVGGSPTGGSITGGVGGNPTGGTSTGGIGGNPTGGASTGGLAGGGMATGGIGGAGGV
jgi:hypothetical protein